MYQVMLADDESIDLEGMERLIPWETFGMKVAAAVTSGFEALQVVQAASVDIMISDIKMPIMSGLELARRALEIKPDLKIIFVSGYEDFHYAKQAIQLNAFGYVLKPLDEQELMRLLNEVKASLDQERERVLREAAYEQSKPLVRNDLMNRWLEGEELDDDIRPYFVGLFAIDTPLHAVIVEVDDFSLTFASLPIKKRQEHLQRWVGCVERYCSAEDIPLFSRVEALRMALIFNHAEPEKVMTCMIAGINAMLLSTITAALAPPVQDWVDLPAAYAEAKQILACKIVCGKNRLIQKRDIPETAGQDMSHLEDILQTMFIAMSGYDLVKVDDSLQDLFVIMTRLGNKLTVHHFTVHIITRLDMYLMTLNENLQSILGIDFNRLNILFDFETAADIQSWLRRRFFEISEHLHLKKMKKNRKLVDEIEVYVKQQLDQNITLRNASNYFCLSPNYLGHLFKEEAGETFSDYVVRQRMEKARGLLQDHKLRVYEVADRVGYKNLTSFCRQFKDYFGLTPNEFRRQS